MGFPILWLRRQNITIKMLEQLQGKFILTTQDGKIDMRATLLSLTGQLKSRHELPVQTYLQTLKTRNRQNVQNFAAFLQSVDPDTTHLALIAVGSSVRPQTLQDHPVEDIDLRILNSAPTDSAKRKVVIAFLLNGIRGYLTDKFEFEESKHTVTSYKSGYIGWYNTDPSFVARRHKRFPLHISVSGIDNYPMNRYLTKERQHNGYFSLLLKT